MSSDTVNDSRVARKIVGQMVQRSGHGFIDMVAYDTYLAEDPVQHDALTGRESPLLRSVANIKYGAADIPAREVPQPLDSLEYEGGLIRLVAAIDYPSIRIYENLITAEEADHICASAGAQLHRSEVMKVSDGISDSVVDQARTSFGTTLFGAGDAVVDRINARLASLLCWPKQKTEELHILRYEPGGEYQPHYDFFSPEMLDKDAVVKIDANRVGTFILYLNDCKDGGETIFPDIGFRIRPCRGYGLYFAYPMAHPETLTLHGGAPVKAGEKWIATRWLTE